MEQWIYQCACIPSLYKTRIFSSDIMACMAYVMHEKLWITKLMSLETIDYCLPVRMFHALVK
jgi:hypothetical protein